jgi:hypothetical protein
MSYIESKTRAILAGQSYDGVYKNYIKLIGGCLKQKYL